MKSELRKDLLAAVERLSDRYPHWRLGQLVANVAAMADMNIWDAEDEQLLAAANSHLSYQASLGCPAEQEAKIG